MSSFKLHRNLLLLFARVGDVLGIPGITSKNTGLLGQDDTLLTSGSVDNWGVYIGSVFKSLTLNYLSGSWVFNPLMWKSETLNNSHL